MSEHSEPDINNEAPWVRVESRKRRRHRYFPIFRIDEVCSCIEHLTDGKYLESEREADVDSLREHKVVTGLFGFFSLKILPLVAYVFVAAVAFITWAVIRSVTEAASRNNGDWRDLALALPLFVAFLVAGVAIASRRWAEFRFHRAVAQVQVLIHGSNGAAVYRAAKFANIAGKAAKAFFQAQQGRRFTWVSPPSVADRALMLAFPLINVRLDHELKPGEFHDVIGIYAEFLYFAAGLEAARRTDLIPKLRVYYAENRALPCRNSASDGEVPERDALFLDPMRNHSRWAVAKDFLYPLSSWFSLTVAVIALVLSAAK